MNTDEIPEYESHPYYPTRFFRYAVTRTHNPNLYHADVQKTLQQKWRNISGVEEWRDIPEVLIEPNVTVEEVSISPIGVTAP